MPDRTINDLAREIHQTAVEKGWWEEARNIGEVFMLMVTEIAEAYEEYRDGRSPTEVWYRDNGKPEGIGVELADTVIRIFDYCHNEGINIQEMIELKVAYNHTRPYRHGGKKA